MARAEMPRRPMPAPPSPISGRYMRLKDHIRQIPDFPKPGILFYDISTLLAHAEAWRATVEQLSIPTVVYYEDDAPEQILNRLRRVLE